jgi:hypothetical protein
MALVLMLYKGEYCAESLQQQCADVHQTVYKGGLCSHSGELKQVQSSLSSQGRFRLLNCCDSKVRKCIYSDPLSTDAHSAMQAIWWWQHPALVVQLFFHDQVMLK